MNGRPFSNLKENVRHGSSTEKTQISPRWITASFPCNESYGLKAQIRRAGVSIPSNIAEGCGRSGDTELARFCDIAGGSASELKYQLLLASDLESTNNLPEIFYFFLCVFAPWRLFV
ncbi:MAG: four helix bundle protein [Acidobacteria bacterium]|nr:four helix bundle protein [Acidobacteriota bacterium]